MAKDKWAKLERWLQSELARSIAHRDNKDKESTQFVAWNNAVMTLTDVIEKMAEIEGEARAEAQAQEGQQQ